MSIPLGWRFSPTKVETIFILNSLTNGRSLPGIQVNQGYDVFGNLTPSELFQATLSNTNSADDTVGRYFYTRMKRLAKNGKNFKRTVEKINDNTKQLECVGTWKGGTAPDQIFDPNTKSLIGESRFYTFNEPSSDRWLMTSFCLAGDAVQDMQLDSDVFAICRIYKKETKKRNGTLTTLPDDYQPQQETVATNPMTSLYYYQPQPQPVVVRPMMLLPNYNQPQAQTVTVSRMMSPNDYQLQPQIVAADPQASPNYYQPQPQTVSVNPATESGIDNNNLYSRDEMENIEAVVDNLGFSGMNDYLDANLAEDQFDWIDCLNTADFN